MSQTDCVANYDFQQQQCSFGDLFNLKLGSDGTVHQDGDGVTLVSNGFTKTVPLDSLGRLDYFKMVATTNQCFALVRDCTTSVHLVVAGQQFFHGGTPIPAAFTQRTKNIDSDYRLAHAGVVLYFPDLDAYQGIAITNDTIYATFGCWGLREMAIFARSRVMRLPNGIQFPFTSCSYDVGNVWGRTDGVCYENVPDWNEYGDEYQPMNQCVHMNAVPIYRYESNCPLDVHHHLTMEVNPGRDFLRWRLNGEVVFTHFGILQRGAEPYRGLHRYGETGRAIPRRMYLMMGNFSMLDHALPNNYSRALVESVGCFSNTNRSQLVALTGPQEYLNVYKNDYGRYDPLDDSAFAISNDIQAYRLFGQGASLAIRRICITRTECCNPLKVWKNVLDGKPQSPRCQVDQPCPPIQERSYCEDDGYNEPNHGRPIHDRSYVDDELANTSSDDSSDGSSTSSECEVCLSTPKSRKKKKTKQTKVRLYRYHRKSQK